MRICIEASDDTKYFANMCNITAEADISDEESYVELKAQPIIYLQMMPGETHEEAVTRMTNMLYDAGFDILNSTLTTENTTVQRA